MPANLTKCPICMMSVEEPCREYLHANDCSHYRGGVTPNAQEDFYRAAALLCRRLTVLVDQFIEEGEH